MINNSIPLLCYWSFSEDINNLYTEEDRRPTPSELSVMIANKINQLDSCWSKFNTKHKYYNFLVEYARMGSVLKSENIPEEPQPSDNPNLEC